VIPRRELLYFVALGAFAGCLAIAPNCNAPDPLQALMLFVLPPVAGTSVGVAAGSSSRVVAVTLGIVTGGGTWLLTVYLWLSTCLS
jgi:hypothetical protein